MTAQKVYVITSEGGPTKIGISLDPNQRRIALQGQFKDRKLSVAHITDVDGLKASEVERRAHDLLKAVHVHGEWFDVSATEAIEAIDIALEAVRDAGIIETRIFSDERSAHMHVRITLESSTKDRLIELARIDKRSPSNYVTMLLLKDQREREPAQ